jgi:hypothetical protein
MRNSFESDGVDVGVSRAARWLIGSAVVVFLCGVLAIVLPLTFSVGVAALLGWILIFAAVAHVVFGIHFGSGTLAWHAFIAALYALAAINLLLNPLLGVLGNWHRSHYRRDHRDRSLFRAPRVSARHLDSDRRRSHSCARDCGMRTLATCQPGACSIPCRDESHVERHLPPVAGPCNSRCGGSRDSGWMNKKQSVQADARVFACFSQATNSTRRVRACASAGG